MGGWNVGFNKKTTMDQPYLTSKIKKNVEYRTDYKKAAVYQNEDPNVEIYKRIMEGEQFLLPAGTYKITAVADFDLPETEIGGEKKKYKLPLELTVKVS